MNAQAAFVSSFAPSLRTSAFAPPARAPTAPRFIAAPRMNLKTDEKPDVDSPFRKTESDRVAKMQSQYRGPQGFTPYAERVNGRLAQLGFVIGLVTELVSGKGINEQIVIMFSPLVNLVESLTNIST